MWVCRNEATLCQSACQGWGPQEGEMVVSCVTQAGHKLSEL